MSQDENAKGDVDRRLTDDSILTTRRDALRRMGQAAAAVALGGLAAACSQVGEKGPPWDMDVRGATLRRPKYSGSGRSGSDTDASRTADPAGDSDVTTSADPPHDSDVTTFGDPAGAGYDADSFDPVGTDADSFDSVGGGTDSDITVQADPKVNDTDVATTADPKGDSDVTVTADPVG